MLFFNKDNLTNFTEWKAEYCKFMLRCTKNNIHIKILMTIISLALGLLVAYWQLGRENEYEANVKSLGAPVETATEE